MTHNASTNFDSIEFRAEAKILGITCHQISVVAHWSIEKVEKYHEPIRRAYDIIQVKTRGIISKNAMLQMAFKAVNDTAGPNGLVPTLLVFGAYSRIVTDSLPSASQQQRANAMTKAMSKLRKLKAQRKVEDALNTRNGPDTIQTLPLALSLGSKVQIYREKKGWTGPFKVLGIADADITIDTGNGPVTFRNTHVKPYHRHTEDTDISYPETINDLVENPADKAANEKIPTPLDYLEPERPRRRGRPWKSHFTNNLIDKTANIFINHRERTDYELALKLRHDGIITTSGNPFQQSDLTEIEFLLDNGVLQPLQYDSNKHASVSLFKSRLVREIKRKATDKPYEKSRLIVQGYNDTEKTALLTQAPTIQRCSQRLFFSVSPTLQKRGMKIMLRDITQAYTQSKTELNRTVICHLSVELKKRYPEGTILLVVKPLYSLAEAGNH